MPPAVQALSLNQWTIREVPSLFFLIPTRRSIRHSQAYKITSRTPVLAGARRGEEGVKF